jgi:glycosyltransferase involved in cell wall biosynthesis
VPGTDILVVSAGSTQGWRTAADELVGAIGRAGASVELVTAEAVPRVRTFALTDFVQARSARAAAERGIDAHEPRAIVYCSITASLLWPRPGAIFLDSIAAENRPGHHGIWQRSVERRRLRASPLVITWSARSLDPLKGPRPDSVVVPVPVEPAPSSTAALRDLAAVTYAGDPVKRQLTEVLDAWARARRDDEPLVVAGLAADARERIPGLEDRLAGPGVEVAAPLAPAEFRALLARARLLIAAPRIEDYGIAALEALASGCQLVTTLSRGPYPARELARELDPRLVADERLDRAIRIALDDPRPGYAQRAADLLAPFTRAAVDRTVADAVLPRLLSA